MLIRALLMLLTLVAVPAESARAADDGGPALWRIGDADTTVYLFGTIHALPPGVDWYRGPVVAAFEQSDEIVFETLNEDDAAIRATYTDHLMLPEGKSLRARLPQAVRGRFDLLIARAGMPAAMADRLKPWAAAFVLGGVDGQRRRSLANGSLGVETVLDEKAKQAGKSVGEIEGVERQLALLDAVPSPLQIRFLRETLEDTADAAEEEALLLGAWSSGDVTTLERITAVWPADPEMRAVLLDRRNANWAEWLEQRLEQPGVTMLAVGAAHLVGPDSVQHHLAERGIAAERVDP